MERNLLGKEFINYFNYDYEEAYLLLGDKLNEIDLIEDCDYVCGKYGKETGYYNEICKDLFNHFYDNTDILKYIKKLITKKSK